MDHKLQIILAAKDISGSALTKFKGSLGAITKSVFSLRGAIGTLAGSAGLGYLVKSSLDAADAIGKAADVAGIHTGVLQEYQHAAQLSGVSTDLLNQSFLAFNKRLGEAQANTGPLVTYLNKVDTELLANIRSAGNTEKALELVFQRMGSLTNAADRAALANAAFSRSGVKLVNMTKAGAVSLENMRAEARRLGLVIDDELIDGAEAANDNLGTLGRVLKTQVTAAVVGLAPKITEVSGGILTWVENNQELIQQDVPKYIGEIGESFVSLGNKVGETMERSKKMYEIFKLLMGTSLWKLDRPASYGVTGSWEEDPPPLMDAHVKAFLKNKKKPPPQNEEKPPPATDYGFLNRTDSAYRMSRAGGVVDRMGSIEAAQQAALERITASTQVAYDAMDSHVTAYYDNLEAQQEKSAAAVDYFAGRMSTAFADFVTTGKFSFKDFSNSIINDLIRIQSRAMFTNLFSSIGAAGGGGGFFTSLFAPNAAGGAYGPMGRMAFANGGIVNRPTLFPFAGGTGLMGEAGPEAIMPLRRTSSGKLGVESSGGKGINNYNNYNINITAMDARSMHEHLSRSGVVEKIFIENISGNGPVRHSIMENV